jgi:hypothetical protein
VRGQVLANPSHQPLLLISAQDSNPTPQEINHEIVRGSVRVRQVHEAVAQVDARLPL